MLASWPVTAAAIALVATGYTWSPAVNAARLAATGQAASVGQKPKAAEDTSRNPDMTGFAREVDTDGDGKLSREEWRAKGLPESSFNMFEHGRGYVTLADYQTHAAPPGIDLNGDGKLTVVEFKAFDKQMSSRMRNGKAPPPRP